MPSVLLGSAMHRKHHARAYDLSFTSRDLGRVTRESVLLGPVAVTSGHVDSQEETHVETVGKGSPTMKHLPCLM